MQLLLVYYELGQFNSELRAIGRWWMHRDAWDCGLFALVPNTAACQAEIVRDNLQAIPASEHETCAAHCLVLVWSLNVSCAGLKGGLHGGHDR